MATYDVGELSGPCCQAVGHSPIALHVTLVAVREMGGSSGRLGNEGQDEEGKGPVYRA